MSENGNAAEQQFGLQKIYLKDLSFESPEAPHVFTQDWAPEVEVQMQVVNQQLDATTWEVELQLTATAKTEEHTVYLVEVKQAGVFTLQNIPEDQVAPLLGSYCPNLLFPFAREAVSDLVGKGGFPQLLLAPINFDALYMQQLEQQQAGEEPAIISH
ncbi:protein-export chaperone SecB [Acidihalobacter ferrooxydans]|uniref:Protein-export protein SecB n=1 Tax=Acidihalobacter ferrooxydans TaxID=1765967 RepID=A0A1P8UD06_9GAMM|nr:protein-export chaperone SecB [Acidihalobacter ferrooxydans]APZ41747.1 protein-export chaperone SecB [Acidihalobacter ferrooxydans]